MPHSVQLITSEIRINVGGLNDVFVCIGARCKTVVVVRDIHLFLVQNLPSEAIRGTIEHVYVVHRHQAACGRSVIADSGGSPNATLTRCVHPGLTRSDRLVDGVLDQSYYTGIARWGQRLLKVVEEHIPFS
ncbi:hypothetical protein D3C81_1806160 [compost metagenome]